MKLEDYETLFKKNGWDKYLPDLYQWYREREDINELIKSIKKIRFHEKQLPSIKLEGSGTVNCQNGKSENITSKETKIHPLPVIKIRDTIIKCDLETNKCYIEAPADTLIDVAGNKDYEPMFDGKAAWLEPRKKNDNKNEKKLKNRQNKNKNE